MSAKIGADYPESLKAAQDAGVELMKKIQHQPGKESLFSSINDQSELGLGTTDAESNESSMQQLIITLTKASKLLWKDFNTRWSDAIAEVGE